MRKIIGGVFLSLDGVLQGPGGPSEDTTGGFDLGGWVAGMDGDPAVEAMIGMLFTPPYALLLGRFTYDIFAAYWPYQTGAMAGFGEALTKAEKYVLTHRDAGLDWENTRRVSDLDAIARLKKSDGPDLLIQGSGTLYPALLAAGLLDRLTTMTFPVVLGKGKRLFGGGTPPVALAMVEHQVSPGGVVVATYEPGGPVRTGSYATQEPSKREVARQEKMTRTG